MAQARQGSGASSVAHVLLPSLTPDAGELRFPLPQGEGQGEGRSALKAPSPRPSPPKRGRGRSAASLIHQHCLLPRAEGAGRYVTMHGEPLELRHMIKTQLRDKEMLMAVSHRNWKRTGVVGTFKDKQTFADIKGLL